MSLTADSTVSIGLILTIAGALATAATFAAGVLWRMLKLVGELRNSVTRILDDNYTLTQASEDALRTKLANPGMHVPDPRRPGEFIAHPDHK